MVNDPQAEKKCIHCTTSISAAATRCFQCSGYQDWRRFVPLGNSTLALMLSVVALTSVFLPDPRALLKEFNDYLSGTNFAMNATLVDMDINFASVLLENEQNSPAAISSLICLLNIPLDPYSRIRESLRSRGSGKTYDVDHPLTVKETMGVFQIAFKLEQPVLVRPYEAIVITLPTAHISAPLRPGKRREPGQTVTSFCAVGGANLEDGSAVGGIIATSDQLNNMDLLEIIQRADYGKKREHERESDLSIVRDARASKEVGPPP